MTTLFREQAINQQLQRLHGEVVVLPGISHSLITLVLVVVIAAIGTLLVFGSFARTETVSGWLEPTSGIARVYGERTGIVKSMFVAPGSSVKKGDILLSVNGDQYLNDGRSLDAALLTELKDEYKRVQNRIDRLSKAQPLERAKRLSEQESAKQDIALIQSQLQALGRQKALVEKQLVDTRRLAESGYATQTQVDSWLSQQSQLDSELAALERTQAQQQNRVEQIEMDLKLLPGREQDELDLLASRKTELGQQILQMEGARGYTLTAPISGRVASLQVQAGQPVPTTKPILAIIPAEAEFEAKALLPITASGFVEPGQEVQLRYDAFPYQKFGSYKGVVSEVSKTLLLPEEMVNAPVNPAFPTYLATVRLERQTALAYGEDVTLTPGMTFQADIELEERSLLEWLLEPLFSLKGRL